MFDKSQRLYRPRGGFATVTLRRKIMKNTIRITSGKFRGREINTPGGKTHPMGERERLALFNMISEYVPSAVVLDAYAGSGALGIEALSRGASEVVFIENNPSAVRTIKENLTELGANGEVVAYKVSNFAPKEGFDLILADPPYNAFDVTEVAHLTKYLNSGGVFVLSHPGEVSEFERLHLLKSRKYAGATISVFVKG